MESDNYARVLFLNFSLTLRVKISSGSPVKNQRAV
jgi:hypothetical protein